MTTSLRALALLLPLVGLSGCLDEEDRLQLFPDGSGKVHVRVRSALGTSGSPLGAWEGVCAWTDVRADASTFEATGWFEDVNALRVEGSRPCIWRPVGDGAWELEACSLPDLLRDQPLDMIPEPDAFPLLAAAMRDLRLERQVTLPGTIEASRGGAVAGRVVTVAAVGSEWALEAAPVVSAVSAARASVLQLRRTHRQAEEELAAVLSAVRDAIGAHAVARCRPDVDPAGVAAFHEELARARSEYEASPLAREVDAAHSAAAERSALDRGLDLADPAALSLPFNPWKDARTGDWATYLYEGQVRGPPTLLEDHVSRHDVVTVVTWRVTEVAGDVVTVVRSSDRGARTVHTVSKSGPCPLSALLGEPERTRCTVREWRPSTATLPGDDTTAPLLTLDGRSYLRSCVGERRDDGQLLALSARVKGPGLVTDRLSREGSGTLQGYGTADGAEWGLTEAQTIERAGRR